MTNKDRGICAFCNHPIHRGWDGAMVHDDSDGVKCLVEVKGYYCGCDNPFLANLDSRPMK